MYSDHYNFKIPDQHISLSKKMAEDMKWAKETVNAYIERSSFVTSETKRHISKLYGLYQGTLDSADYSYVTNPYNSKKREHQAYPAKLRNYNIIRPVVNLFLGEWVRRPNRFQVVCKNSDLKHRQKEQLSNKLKETLVNNFIAELQLLQQQQNEKTAQANKNLQPGQQPSMAPEVVNTISGNPNSMIKDPEQILKDVAANYQDARAEYGQAAINIMEEDLHLEEIFFHQFFEYLVTGYTASFKTVLYDEPYYEMVPFLEIDYELDPDKKYIEDSNWVVRRKRMSWQAIKDYFRSELEGKKGKEYISRLEGDKQLASANNFLAAGFTYEPEDSYFEHIDNDYLISVYHCVWKAGEKVGILSYRDQFNIYREVEVDETFSMSKTDLRANSMDLRWEYVNSLWEGYRIGDQGDTFFLKIQPYPYSREDVNNTSIVKMPYNGTAYSHRQVSVSSIPELGYPYQVLYNALHYQFELAIAKSKGKIILMEYNAIPKKHGWDEEKFMYFMDAHNLAFIDTQNQEAESLKHFNQYQVLDASLGAHIATILDAMTTVKMEWEELMGITRQRKGDVKASDGKATTERAIFASSTISEEMFWRFDKYMEREYQGLLELSKYAWINGKTVPFKSSDTREALLELDPVDYLESDLNIYAVNSSEEFEKLEKMRELTLAFAQNGLQPSMIAEILDTKSFSKIKRMMSKVEQSKKEYEQSIATQQEEARQATIQMQEQAKESERNFEATQNELNRANERELKRMEITGSILSQSAKAPQDVDASNYAGQDAELQKSANEMAKRYIDEKLKNRELDIKEKEIQSKERIENLKAQTALKNKVSGEK